ncbi:LapA family protein [Entomospira nematocerorum]|uniref:LapA family protein n=1 Tax=Entomospira nematocerorum TaxID=2719987 RepID=A0A968KXL4_9SPIO|nr:LapA family protein [Entomospira nematocera]NIZ46667.1 LapA family protein [Entomospira nematocera]WDI33536.1 LapA family protein [Entomospira nematocera]
MLKLILSTTILIIIGVFVFLNSNQRVVLHLIVTEFKDFPLAIACLLFFVLGLTLSIPFFLADRLQLIKKQRAEIRRLTTHLEATRKELKELGKKSIHKEDIH